MRADAVMEASMAKANEWDLLKLQFDALVRGNSEPERPIEMFLDDQIRRRFVHWISSAAERKAKADNAYQGFRVTHYR
jgi:hypothetical protein